jgi:hypothetical protein
VAYSGRDAPLGTVEVLARKPLCATRSTETRVWYFVYYCGGLAGTAVLGWIFDSFGWAACVSGVGLALAMTALLTSRLVINRHPLRQSVPVPWRRRAALHSGIERLARPYQGAGEPAAPSSSGLGARSAYLLRADAG